MAADLVSTSMVHRMSHPNEFAVHLFQRSVVGHSLIGLTAANKLLIDGLKCCGKPEGQEKTQLALLRGERYWKIASGQGRRAVL